MTNVQTVRRLLAGGSALTVTLTLMGTTAAAQTAAVTPGARTPGSDAPLLLAQAAATLPAAEASQVEGVVVTAERRTTNLQATPLAITSVSGDSLDKSFVTELSGLNGLVPSMQITKASGFENLVTIRGVGSETPENALTTQPGVSEFIDGVFIASTISLDQTLFDVDHIEVLRGPQGALYGQSSIGGALTIVTTQPRLGMFDASGDASAGTYNLTRERAEVNIPVGDTFAIRASVQKYDHDGFTKDIYFPDFRLDDAHDLSGKVAVLWKPTDKFSATFTAQWYHADPNGAAQKNILDPSSDPRVLSQDYPARFRLTTELYHLNLSWDLPWFSIRSVTAYQGLNHVQQEDDTRSTFAQLGIYDDVAGWNTKLQNYNEEFDILSLPGSRLDWIVGAFVANQESRQIVNEFGGFAPNPDLTILPNIESVQPPNLEYGNNSYVSRRSYSAFGQGTYHVLPALRLTLGGRINYDSYSLHGLNYAGISGNGPYASPPVPPTGYSDSEPTGRAELDYDVTPLNLLYASAARGYKPGGVNGGSHYIILTPTFKPETNTAFEVGSKSRLFDKSLRLNFAAFYYIYKNMQYIENDPLPFASAISNIPSIHAYGAEAEAAYVAPDRRLRVNGNLSVENGQVQGDYFSVDSTVFNAIESQPYPSPCAYGGIYSNPGCAAAVIAAERNVKGKTPPAMPKVSGSVNASYAIDIPYGVLTPRAEYVYRGSEWARIFNEPTLDQVKSYNIVNLNLEFIPTSSRLRLSLAATNVFDAAGVNSRYTNPYGSGQTSQQFIAPRQVIATVGYSF